jgi:putative endonuclease
MTKWHVYMIRTRSGTLYTGTATDVERRLEEHRQGGHRGSKYLRSRSPLKLVYEVELGNRSLAYRAECRIKILTKRKKEEIVSAGPTAHALLDLLDFTITS